MDMGKHAQAMLDAGFTVEELRTLGEALMFAVTIAEGYERSAHVRLMSDDWPQEKRAAWDRFIDASMAQIRRTGQVE